MMRSSLDNVEVGPCVGGQRKKGLSSRFSLRRLICSSPILGRRPRINSTSGSSKAHNKPVAGKDVVDAKSSSSSKDYDRSGHLGNLLGNNAGSHHAEIHQATSRTSVFTSSTKSGELVQSMECPLCLAECTTEQFWELQQCGHRACISCLQQYLRVEITESRVAINCPECPDAMHPNEIRKILDDTRMFEKYEGFMVRRVLAVDPDARWCPAPDCSFAVIASECASCPAIKCERPGCNSYFCYHCKAEWHPNQTCDAARAQRSPNIRSNSISYSQDSQHREDIKPCPRCRVLIVKMDDGSCNHMMCAVCGAEFCWLCMKEISDLHYLSPSGCTFWGKKPWSRKKKILWQLGTLVGAPVIIALVAGITVPAMVIGIPVWVGRKLYTRYKNGNKHKRNASIVGGVIGSIMISPILAGLAVGIGVPILLFYVYGVVPVSLCRSGGCGGSSGSEDGNDDYVASRNADSASTDANGSSRVANPSIGEISLSLASGSQSVLRDMDRESASTVALAGSVGGGVGSGSVGNGSGGGGGIVQPQKLQVQADCLVSNQRLSLGSLSDKSVCCASLVDDGASTRALAGSVLNYKHGNGSDCCSCVTTEDCASERVRFEDSVSFVAEKASIGSGCSYKMKCGGSSSSSSSKS